MCVESLIHIGTWQPLFSKKMAAAASFSYKIGAGGKDLATLLAAVLTWSGYWLCPFFPNIQTMSEQPPVMLPNPCRRHQFCRKMRPPPPILQENEATAANFVNGK